MSSTDTAGNPTDCRGQLPVVKNGKIIDMVNAWTAATDQPFISFEYFPPKTPEGVVKLHKVIDEMCKQKPLFVDFTWGAGGSSADLTLELSKTSQQKHNVMVSGAATAAPVALRPPAAPVPSPVRARGVRVR